MDPQLEHALRQIGQQLDQHAFPRVANGGFIVLSEPAVPSSLSTENEHERETERRSAAGSRQRAPGGQRASRGARSSGHTTPVVRADLQAQVEDQLSGLQQQYPRA